MSGKSWFWWVPEVLKQILGWLRLKVKQVDGIGWFWEGPAYLRYFFIYLIKIEPYLVLIFFFFFRQNISLQSLGSETEYQTGFKIQVCSVCGDKFSFPFFQMVFRGMYHINGKFVLQAIHFFILASTIQQTLLKVSLVRSSFRNIFNFNTVP